MTNCNQLLNVTIKLFINNMVGKIMQTFFGIDTPVWNIEIVLNFDIYIDKNEKNILQFCFLELFVYAAQNHSEPLSQTTFLWGRGINNIWSYLLNW